MKQTLYRIRPERSKELKDGRGTSYYAGMLGMTPQNVCRTFAGRGNTRKHTVLILISIKEKIPVNDRQMNEFIEYYFEEV